MVKTTTALPIPKTDTVHGCSDAPASGSSVDSGAALVSVAASPTCADSSSSSVGVMVTVPFLQSSGASAVPSTKLTETHCSCQRNTDMCEEAEGPTWYSRPSSAEATTPTTPFLPMYFSGTVTLGWQ